MQSGQAPVYHAIDQPKQENGRIDRHIALTDRDLIPDRWIAGELPRIQPGDAEGIGQVGVAADLIECLYPDQSRLFQWIVWLFSKQEERAERELMTERAVYGVDQPC